MVISNTYTFSPTWLGNLVFDASLLHLTQTRNSDLGFALAFPFSSTALDHLRLRNFRRQPVRHSHHSFPRLAQSGKISVPLRPEPRCGKPRVQVRRRLHSRTGAQRRVCVHGGAAHHQYPSMTPIYYVQNPAQCLLPSPIRSAIRRPIRYAASPALTLPPATAASRRTCSDSRLYAEDSWRVSHHLTVNYGLRYQTTFGLFRLRAEARLRILSFPLLACRFGCPERVRTTTASRSRLAWESPTLPATARRP